MIAPVYINGWRPIESAPLDGTLVLVVKAGWFKPGIPYEPTAARYSTKFGWVQDGVYPDTETETYQPTHWLPIPPNPVEET
jgi:hypothetical protein